MLRVGQNKSLQFNANRDGECHAMAAWFTLTLGNTLKGKWSVFRYVVMLSVCSFEATESTLK